MRRVITIIIVIAVVLIFAGVYVGYRVGGSGASTGTPVLMRHPLVSGKSRASNKSARWTAPSCPKGDEHQVVGMLISKSGATKITAKFDKNGRADKLTFEAPNGAIDEIIPVVTLPLNISKVTHSKLWGRYVYHNPGRTSKVRILATGDVGFSATDQFLVCSIPS